VFEIVALSETVAERRRATKLPFRLCGILPAYCVSDLSMGAMPQTLVLLLSVLGPCDGVLVGRGRYKCQSLFLRLRPCFVSALVLATALQRD
jgi:hypothetical protein